MFRLSPSLLLAAIGTVATFSGLCHAQWTDNPAANSPLVTASGEQVQPKVVATDDGGAYISWFDNRTGGYDVYMQRINAAGAPQWAADGIMIADRSFSSTQDYDLAVDSDGYAVVAFRDDRFGGIVVTASRVAPDGTQVWGPNGVQPTLTGSTIGAIRVAGTSDGNSVVGWFNGAAARVVKFDSDGNQLWATDIGSSPVGSFSVSDLIASDEPKASGQVVVLMNTFGTFITPRHLYAQKLNADGSTRWAAPVAIHTGSSLQIGNLPGGTTDGNGGVVTAWYETSPLQVRAQHVDYDGAIQFPAGGSVVSTNAGQLRVDPGAAYNAVTGETFVFWREQTLTQAAIGIYGQKFNAAGQRLWTENGVSIFASANETTQVRALLHNDGAQAYFVERLSPSSQRILGTFVDSTGGQETLLGSGVFEVSTAESGKSRLVAIQNSNNQAVLVWQDARNGADDLYAQSINPDGTLGPVDDGPLGDLNGDGVVNVSDLLILFGAWGDCPEAGECPADLNGDGFVNVSDLLILFANWG